MAKSNIEKIFVHTGGDPNGQVTVHWTIGERNFNVWFDGDDRPEDVVHSNPVTPKNPRANEHRALDRTSQAQAKIFAEVMEIVEGTNLIAVARQAARDKIAADRRRNELINEAHALRDQVIAAWHAGEFSASCRARELLLRQHHIMTMLAAVDQAADVAA